MECEVWSVKEAVRSEKCEVRTVKCEVWSVKCEVWSVKTLLRLSLKKNRLSREGHARDRLALNYRSFILGKLPPPACPGLYYHYDISMEFG